MIIWLLFFSLGRPLVARPSKPSLFYFEEGPFLRNNVGVNEPVIFPFYLTNGDHAYQAAVTFETGWGVERVKRLIFSSHTEIVQRCFSL